MAGENEIAFFRFMEARRLVGSEEKSKFGVTHFFFGCEGYRELKEDEMVKDRGAFHVSDEDYPEYKRLYLAALREDAYLNVMEKPRDFSMLCVDIDIRLAKNTITTWRQRQLIDDDGYEDERIESLEQERQYEFVTLKDAHLVHKVVLDALENKMMYGINKLEAGFLMQRRKKGPSSKDGFHLVYPRVVIGEYGKRHTLDEVNRILHEAVSSKMLFANLDVDLESCAELADKGVVKGFWAAPGSCKNGSYLYVITACFKGYNHIEEFDPSNRLWTQPKFAGKHGLATMDMEYTKEGLRPKLWTNQNTNGLVDRYADINAVIDDKPIECLVYWEANAGNEMYTISRMRRTRLLCL